VTPFPASRNERFAAGALVGGVIVFALITVVLLRVGGGWVRAEMLTLLFALLAADLLIAVALLTGWYPVRPVAQGLAIFGAVVYLFVLLRSGPWWMRGWSGLLAAAHVYALVLLFALGSRERYDDEDDEDEADRPDEPGVAAPAVEEPGATMSAPEDEPIEVPAPGPAGEPEPEPPAVSTEVPALEPEPAEVSASEPEPAEVSASDPEPAEVPASDPEPAEVPASDGVPDGAEQLDGTVDGDVTNDEKPDEANETSDNHPSDDETAEPQQPRRRELADEAEPVETAVGTVSARSTGGREEDA
jgi:hypothetical protein